MSVEEHVAHLPGSVLDARPFPVVELFGPTIQGEGPDAGRVCFFVRLGLCDYRCSWCDSMHAVDPERVRASARQLRPAEVVNELQDLGAVPGSLVILSGGNPAVHDLTGLVGSLRYAKLRVAVETQGSIWRPWLEQVQRLIVSPKPPSSGMVSAKNVQAFYRFMEHASPSRPLTGGALKVVVSSGGDLAFARGVHLQYRTWPFYLSALTNHETTTQIDDDGAAYEHPPQTTDLRDRVGQSYRWLCEHVAGDPDWQDVVVLPQLHVIAWGAELGR